MNYQRKPLPVRAFQVTEDWWNDAARRKEIVAEFLPANVQLKDSCDLWRKAGYPATLNKPETADIFPLSFGYWILVGEGFVEAQSEAGFRKYYEEAK